MAPTKPLFEDFARVAQGAAGALVGLRDELEARIKDQVDRVLSRMNLVRREEFEAVQAMAAKARREQEALRARLDALEGWRKGGASRKTGSTRSPRGGGARGKSR